MGVATQVTLISHKKEVLQAKDEDIERALETIGRVAERYAKQLCAVDTGRLRNSITHEVDMSDNSVIIGTNVEYAPYVEFGTGKYAEGGGRPTPWFYRDEQGHWHKTSGQKPQPFIRPAIDNHIDEYKEFVKSALLGES